ncbi:MAG: type II toxin-antitoxin system HicA family toxin [Dolichospermum sp. DET50]|nr:type II toxin-antitoxin system HicA family toxin [Dolichospermum sp. DET66]MBS3034500.1 type II toxin-antitoxin system HicA family toxin [Dolichospermum sp. DET67]MBS3039703.1 type II toxin-antitoxin system HicA family toxin [Dolichospermum sp. DET50]QSX66908.1 MAG: type II toxin-antitoxin system HicA family toxin [Dolichospermum sp. DET69]
MKSISGKKLCKIIERKGWILKKTTGSHHIYEKPDETKIISIPVHRNQDLKSIMKMAELLEDDLIA